MTAQRDPENGQAGRPVPRDMPDQQAGPGNDAWDAPQGRPRTEARDVPDTDEAGTGPRGVPPEGSDEQPTPDEPPA
ncbi:hypothetical protein AQJ66_35960 [Streptomyces bungoensis]|uniref:Uncharacterized protein n=1 Tax=Streptomyces bungoensis TaxID=285568 RepID=A0A101SJG0_9ACTN|nr:hypothetical protein [Streptomyces bungoensis]KUN75327.1 hypothetical protein AQJ66_35960 [Streptomyces bungoensis]